jgi:hypothetical protein
VTDNVSKASSIGLGDWEIDSHMIQRVAIQDPYNKSQWRVVDEGELESSAAPSHVKVSVFQVPYEAIIPKKEELTNLLVPVCLSSSHIGFQAYRLEPQYMIIGQSAAVAATMAVEHNQPVQDVDIQQLQDILRKQGQVIDLQ